MTDVFSPILVQELYNHQHNSGLQPYTCGKRTDGKHLKIGSDLGMLIHAVRGCICPFCDYTQDWAHDD